MIWQPFEPFKPVYIPKLLEQKKYWLVSQTCQRYNLPGKTGLLLTDYDDVGKAKAHRQALTGDDYAALLDLQNPVHKAKLLELTAYHSRFHVCWAVVKSAKDMEDTLSRRYRERMRRYIATHTRWRISRDTVLQPSVQLERGELMVEVHFGNEGIKFKFEELETA